MIESEDRVLEDLVDTGRYRLSNPTSAGWREVVSHVQDELRSDGCCVLHDFVRASLGDTLQREGTELAPRAYHSVETVNVYNTAVDPSLPEWHPAHIEVVRGNAFVARDLIPGGHIVHQLYTSAQFQQFIADCFERPRLYELSDPMAGLCLNIVAPGQGHPWHFDTNEFTVTMITQEAQAGGVFEFCPDIRSAEAENFEDVRAVLTGQGDRHVRRLSLRRGDLQLFRGRYSMHRVTTVGGLTARHSAIFAYSECPGVIGSLTRTKQLFGRVSPAHLAADSMVRVDGLWD
jgi:hypothetical protein